ncbi:TonB-dependent receptor plug domain-containing protein [Haliangium ochraceum]|uniref:TonB-dependent receptor plug n=1 Tax=Haliangium ochraceum (strain DSM 14365 / JCM 11303 / SMP-2) TaxID=502025 RepID=D0LQN4_HALO1|nr:TonB-dependent receptor [Haliangium ochraceum]ACY13594.1 TonB-dependent receptor plug [Haliangium ochraceum DSM 14365]
MMVSLARPSRPARPAQRRCLRARAVALGALVAAGVALALVGGLPALALAEPPPASEEDDVFAESGKSDEVSEDELDSAPDGPEGAVIELDLDEIEALDDSTQSSLEVLLGAEVVTAAKVAQKRSDSPMTIYIITEEQIRTRGYVTLEDALEDIPEIEIQDNAINETRNSYTARGINGNEKFLILVDGFRFNSPAGTPHIIGHNIPLYNAARVEVVLGPASAVYGVDAFSGIINILTRSGGDLGGAQASASYGSFNTTHGWVQAGERIQDVAIAIGAFFHHSDGADYVSAYPDDYRWYREVYRDTGLVRASPFAPPEDVIATGAPRPFDVASDAYALHGRLDMGGFTFGYMRSFERHSSSMGTQPEYAIYSEDARIATEHVSAFAKHTHTLETQPVRITASAHYATYDMLPTSRFVNTFGGYYNGGFKYGTERSMDLDLQVDYQPLSWLTITQGITAKDLSAVPKGADLPRPFDPSQAAETQNIPHVGTDVVTAEGDSLAVPVRFFHVNERSYGTYLESQVTPTESVRLTLGARYDYHERYGSTLNPRLGVVLKPWRQLTLRALFATASLAPGPYRAFQNFGSFTVERDAAGTPTGLTSAFWFVPNPALRPETIRSGEVGLSWLATSQLAVSARGHYVRVEDLISTSEPTPGVFEGVPTGAIQSHVNRGALLSYGGVLRAELRLQPGDDVTLWPHLAYSFVTGELNAASGPGSVVGLAMAAPHTVKMGVDGSWRALSGALRINARSASRNTLVAPALVAGPLLDVALSARYQVYERDGWRLWAHAQVDNLLDSRNRHVMASYDPSQFSTVPQAPRQILIGLSGAATP